MDGVIVAAAHDEFRGMGLGMCAGLWVRAVCWWRRGMFDAQRRGNDFKQEDQFTYW